MIKKVIAYFNNELHFYENLKVVENQSNADITGSCKRYLGMCPVQDAMSCKNKSIFIVGEFDDEKDSPLVPYDDPVLIVNCDDILSNRFKQLYEQQNN